MKYKEYKGLSKMSPHSVCEMISKDQDLKLYICENMETYGGSFVQALAECLRRADSKNTFKLCDAFQEYMWQYLPEKWERDDGKLH